MPTAPEAARYKRANDDLATRIERDLRKAWAALGAATPDQRRDVLLDVTPGLVRRYGEIAGALAADYFEATTGARATIVEPNEAAMTGSVRALAGGLYTGLSAPVLTAVTAATVRHALQAGRSTIYGSAARTRGIRFARVPEPGACDWCRILSSRGAVYASRETAGGEGNEYHDGCGCHPIAIRDGDELPYDAAALYDEYRAAWEAAGGSGVQAGTVAQHMRRLRTENTP